MVCFFLSLLIIKYYNNGNVANPTITLPSNGFVKANNTFTGWNYGAVGTKVTLTGNITVIAQWKANPKSQSFTLKHQNGDEQSWTSWTAQPSSTMSLEGQTTITGTVTIKMSAYNNWQGNGVVLWVNIGGQNVQVYNKPQWSSEWDTWSGTVSLPSISVNGLPSISISAGGQDIGSIYNFEFYITLTAS